MEPVDLFCSFSQVERPNIGCRELVKSNLGRIVPAILNDITDWVESTRIKSIQLLYVFIWQAEDNITQHLELVLQTLFKAASDTESLVRAKTVDCARLLGYFTNAELTFRLLLQAIKRQPNGAAICVLNGIVQGYQADKLYSHLNAIMDNLVECCSTVEVNQLDFEGCRYFLNVFLSFYSSACNVKSSTAVKVS
jgi:hypothetical protein